MIIDYSVTFKDSIEVPNNVCDSYVYDRVKTKCSFIPPAVVKFETTEQRKIPDDCDECEYNPYCNDICDEYE